MLGQLWQADQRSYCLHCWASTLKGVSRAWRKSRGRLHMSQRQGLGELGLLSLVKRRIKGRSNSKQQLVNGQLQRWCSPALLSRGSWHNKGQQSEVWEVQGGHEEELYKREGGPALVQVTRHFSILGAFQDTSKQSHRQPDSPASQTRRLDGRFSDTSWDESVCGRVLPSALPAFCRATQGVRKLL